MSGDPSSLLGLQRATAERPIPDSNAGRGFVATFPLDKTNPSGGPSPSQHLLSEARNLMLGDRRSPLLKSPNAGREVCAKRLKPLGFFKCVYRSGHPHQNQSNPNAKLRWRPSGESPKRQPDLIAQQLQPRGQTWRPKVQKAERRNRQTRPPRGSHFQEKTTARIPWRPACR